MSPLSAFTPNDSSSLVPVEERPPDFGADEKGILPVPALDSKLGFSEPPGVKLMLSSEIRVRQKTVIKSPLILL